MGVPQVTPPGKDMGPVEVLWDGDGVISLDVGRHTPVKTLPSHIPLEMRAVIIRFLVKTYDFECTYLTCFTDFMFSVCLWTSADLCRGYLLVL